ncbi:response regulator [Mucilaginibacter sp. UR6-1]|uniref:response regulator n=1 Tax=Mucilaginibacter sp. UR6-1 TaxID=1435643 RepID=UPI001E36AF70|nr:response regulator [Mucilaginibacter sp. UR6-1]MCC8408150.1 response regulator [Mucilaginibacter sp. UR6-1]
MNLLIIDDEPIQHLIYDKMLDIYVPDASSHTMHSYDGANALEFLRQNSGNAKALPDMIFMDIHMASLSGFDFLERFKKLSQRLIKHIEVYVISSSIDPEDIDRSKGYSFVKDYIIKPVTQIAIKNIFNANGHYPNKMALLNG